MKYLLLMSSLLSTFTAHAVDITACELLQSQQAGNVQLLDVRSQAEYDKGHILEAKLIPHTELEQRYSELDKEKPVVVYCQSGRRAAIAESLLEEKGFTSIYLLKGHWQAWDEKQTLLRCKSSVTVLK